MVICIPTDFHLLLAKTSTLAGPLKAINLTVLNAAQLAKRPKTAWAKPSRKKVTTIDQLASAIVAYVPILYFD